MNLVWDDMIVWQGSCVVHEQFSAKGLAGLRVGYGIMSPGLVQHIMDIKSPYNVNIAAEVALLASLEDAPALLDKVEKIVNELRPCQVHVFDGGVSFDGVYCMHN